MLSAPAHAISRRAAGVYSQRLAPVHGHGASAAGVAVTESCLDLASCAECTESVQSIEEDFDQGGADSRDPEELAMMDYTWILD